MPVHKVGNKWAIGHGKARYKTKAAALRAYRAILAAKYGRRRRRRT
jgi:hypothetical protein